jgi:EmrB/QacA subfamily drug resistance transporter
MVTPCDDGVVRAAPAAEPACAAAARPWVLVTAILGSSMAFIDGSVVNVALPAMQADLGVPLREAQWIVNAYMLTLGALMLVGGAAGDRFGRRRLFCLGVLSFGMASAGCALAPNAPALIGLRALQGVGGALLVPGSLALISAAYPEPERGRAIGTWAGASALTTALGPVLGGWLVDAWSWRTIFFVNLPVAAAVLVIAWRSVPESRGAGETGEVDWRGGALATAGLGAIAYGLTAASDEGWLHGRVLAPLAVGILVLAVFVRAESRAAAPMMPLGLFRSPAFSGANGITLLLYFALSGALFLLPFNLIHVQGYSAMWAGAAFLPFSLVMGGLSRWSGGLIERYGARPALMFGPIVVAAGFALCAVPGIGGSYWSTFFLPMVLLGLGMAIAVAPLTATVMGAADERHAGVASGVNNAVARIAGLLAVALLGSMAVSMFRGGLEERLAALPLSEPVRQAVLEQAPRLAEADPPARLPAPQRQALQRVMDESFVSSFRTAMLVAAGLALLSAACAGLTIRPPPRRRD